MNARRLALAVAPLLWLGCATTHGGAGGHSSAAVTQPTDSLPVCGMEDPWLPDPCRVEVTPGEWLRVSNAGPEREQRKHSRWWWLLMALVTL